MPTLSRIFNLRVFLIPVSGDSETFNFTGIYLFPGCVIGNRVAKRDVRFHYCSSPRYLSVAFFFFTFESQAYRSALLCISFSLGVYSLVRKNAIMYIACACMHACAFLQASLEGSYRGKEEGRVSTYGKARRRVYRTQHAKGYLIDFRSVDYIF